jgi:hypothetical protein
MTTPSKRKATWLSAVAVIVVLLTIVVRVRRLDIPLERDDGEYAYAGQLILQGVPPYALVYNMKFPGIYYAFAGVVGLFGQTQTAVHLGLLVVNLLTTLFVLLIGRRLFDPQAAAGAAAAFAVLSLSPSVAGLAAHATHFVLLPALAGIWVLLCALNGGRPRAFLMSGVLLGVAMLMKQHGAAFLIFAVALVAWKRLRAPAADRKRWLVESVMIGAGAAIPLAVTAATLLASGVFSRFWLWTFHYASQYVSERSAVDAPAYLARGVLNAAATGWPVWALAAIGLTLLSGDATRRRNGLIVAGLLGCSFLGTVPGFYFRPHYFILMLPAIALLAGAAPQALGRVLARRGAEATARAAGAIALVAALAAAIGLDGERLFVMTPARLMRSVYHQNPFPEALEIARYLEARVAPGETIAVFGSEPEIFFYTGRRSATGYIYMYPLMENQDLAATMRKDMLREIEAARPAYAVFVGINTSWIDHPSSDTKALDAMMDYAEAKFEDVGLLEILGPDHTEARWEGQLAGYAPQSPYRIVVLKRRAAPG